MVSRAEKEYADYRRKVEPASRKFMNADGVKDCHTANAAFESVVRLVDDAAVDDILCKLGPTFASLSDQKREALRRRINAEWHEWYRNGLEQRCRQPHKRAEQWERIRVAAAALRSLLKKDWTVEVELAWHLPMESSTVRNEKVSAAVSGVGQIEEWVSLARDEARSEIGTRLGNRSLYAFVRGLAQAYKQAFDRAPTATRGGAWEMFLGEALALCDNKRLREDAVHSLWLKARKSGAVSWTTDAIMNHMSAN